MFRYIMAICIALMTLIEHLSINTVTSGEFWIVLILCVICIELPREKK